jgi:hypothetical protein
MVDQSPRPKPRPKLKLSYNDLMKIERVVNAEAKGEGVEGRNAVRGVIFNRLMSDRFPNTVDEVLSPSQFEPVRKYGSIDKIPVDEDSLNAQLTEMADYIQLGEDASKGSTFFLNKELSKKRGTDFAGENPMVIGNHTFYKGYQGQEPVTDVNFSHDIELDYQGYDGGGMVSKFMDMITAPVSREYRKEKPLSVKAADEAISLATPIDSIAEIKDELAKENPDYLKIGMLGGMEAVGLLTAGTPKAALSMVRKGANMARQTDNVIDVASNVPKVPKYEGVNTGVPKIKMNEDAIASVADNTVTQSAVDLMNKAPFGEGFNAELQRVARENGIMAGPNTGIDPMQVYAELGDRVRNPDFKIISNSSISDLPTVQAAGLTDEAIDAWREANATSPEFRKALKGREEGLMSLAEGVKEGRVFNTTYWKRADELRPIRKVTEVPKPASVQQTVSALDSGKRKSPIVGLNYDIPDGDVITARLDIPAYVDYDTWIPTLRHGGKTMYKPALRMKNVKFIQPEGREVGMALDVAVGPQRLEETFGLAKKKAQSKGNKSPFAVMEGEYVKSTDDEAYEYARSVFDSDEWVQAGYDPTKRGFFYDRETGEAILSGDEVIQVGHLVLVKNAKKVNPEAFGYSEGGMAMNEQMDAVFKSSRTGYAEGGEVGEAPDTTIGVDPVSGNEIPMGARPEEVRDDIPAQLSEGEYVVPADVVRFYGVRFFEELRTGAKQGYAEMDQNGRIGGEPVEPEGMEMIEPEDDLPFDISELQMVDDDEEMPVGAAEGGYFERAINREKPINNFEKLLQFLFKDKDEYGETPIDRYKAQMGEDDDMGFFESMMGNPIERGERKWGKKGYALGGLPEAPATTPVPLNPFNPIGSASDYEIKEYVNDAGEVMYIQFSNGQPMTFIPQGFKTKGTAAEQAATGEGVAAETAPTTAPSDGNDNNYDLSTEMGKVDAAFTDGASAKDWTKATADEFASARKGLGIMGTAGKAAGLLMGGPLGLAAGIGSQSQARVKAYDMIDGIAYQLETLSQDPVANEAKIKALNEQKKELQKIVSTGDDGKDKTLLGSTGIYGGQTSLYERLSDTGGGGYDESGKPKGDGKVSFADTWLGDLLGADGKIGVQGDGLVASLGGARRSGTGADYEGDKTRAEARMQQREATPYEKAMAEADYGKASSEATKSWQAATNAVAAAQKSGDILAMHEAIRAQSDASRAATQAKQKETGKKGFWG